MYKSVLRAAPRSALQSRRLPRSSSAGRLISSGPAAQTRRGWTNSGIRWGVAVGAIYLYSTSSVFAEEPEAAIRRLDDSILAVQESNQPTLDAIVEEKRRREAQQAAEEREKERLARAAALASEEEEGEEEGEGGMDGLAGEADSQGAFNPETGEINWDCPCLGGMAHGPCGEEFKAAFSCFVYSNEEPKGIECIDKFKGMQDCFRQHPEMYGSELEDDEDEVEEELLARENGSPRQPGEHSPEKAPGSTPPAAQKTPEPTESKLAPQETDKAAENTTKATPDASTQAAVNEQDNSEKDDELIPKAAHDATRK